MTTNNGPASMITLRAVTVQALMDKIAGKAGATLDDVGAALQALAGGGDPAAVAAVAADLAALRVDFDELVRQLGIDPPGGLLQGTNNTDFQGLLDVLAQKPGASVADVQAQFALMGQAIQEAIQSGMRSLPDTIRLNCKGDPGKVTIEANNLDSSRIKTDVHVTAPFGGQLFVNEHRVLTVADAISPAEGGLGQAAVEAAVAAATAPLLARIEALEAEVAARPTTEYMQEQFGNFNDLLTADISQTAQLALAEQVKLQRVIDLLGGDQTIGTTTVEQAVAVFSGLNTIIAENIVAPAVEVVQNKLLAYMNALAGKANPTPTEVRRALDEIAEYITGVEQWANQMISDVVDYVAVEFGKYTTKDEFAALNTELEGFANEAVPSMVQSELENRIPAILEALQTHLENVLAIFGGGGTTGVTPAQITDLTAEFARVYATKESLAAYAKLDDGNQEINAGLVKARGVQFTINDEVLVPLDFDDYGTRLSLIPQNATSVDEAGIVVVHTDLADLIPGAKES